MNMRPFLGRALAAVALSTAAVGLTAGPANAAVSIYQLRAECLDANGGTWVAYTSPTTGKVTSYSCYYTDSSGDGWVDDYDRYGNYRGTS